MKYSPVANFINGEFVPASTSRALDVISPIDGNHLSTVPMSSASDLNRAVLAAKVAFPEWSKTPIKDRVQVFFRYKFLLEKNLKELAELIQEENGKTYGEAVAEIEKSIELSEFATSLPQLVTGEVLEVSKGVECRTEYVPVGIVASIVPFNFPTMVPNWTIPNALALGNCMIIKPSEKVPLSVGRLASLLQEAGLPNGVFNVVHGDSEIVEAICNHPGIEAVSFVGSTKVAKIVYQRSTHTYKRCLALGGAKNHLMVLPDAIPAMTAQNVAASMSGCAGQRCMAASAMIAVGKVDHIIEKICELILATKVPHNPKNKLSEIICDADLDYLGRDDYYPISQNVYTEFKNFGIVKNEAEWVKLQIKFLESHRYFTNTAINSRQSKKEEHLKKLKSNL